MEKVKEEFYNLLEQNTRVTDKPLADTLRDVVGWNQSCHWKGAELQDFSCYRGWKEAGQATRAISTTWRREL